MVMVCTVEDEDAAAFPLDGEDCSSVPEVVTSGGSPFTIVASVPLRSSRILQ